MDDEEVPYGNWAITAGNGNDPNDPFEDGMWQKTVHAPDENGAAPWDIAYPVGRYRLTVGQGQGLQTLQVFDVEPAP